MLYKANLPSPIAVDVVDYVGPPGYASTVVNPDEILVSSASPANAGYSALEVVFHEASHTVTGFGRGAIWDSLQTAAAADGIEQPDDLWHAILFFTAGKVVVERLAEKGISSYEPYAYREGLFSRAWPQFREPLEDTWAPYVEGRTPLDEAASELLRAVKETAELK